MVAHAGFGEQDIADKQIAAIDGASVLGESWAEHREIRVQCLHQRVGHGSDIALITCRAPARLSHASAASDCSMLHGLRRRDRAAFQRHHDRVDLLGRRGGGDTSHPAMRTAWQRRWPAKKARRISYPYTIAFVWGRRYGTDRPAILRRRAS
jgi:hypothetical protein